MRSALAAATQRRHRSSSLTTVPPASTSQDFLPELAGIAASILYRSPQPSLSGLPVYILNAAAFPDAYEIDYDSLLPYVLARLPGLEELISGTEYEVIFFAGGQPEGATTEKKQGPGVGWYLQAYHVLNRATRKKLQRLYIVHPRTWVRVLVGVFGTVVSPKFRRKIVHANTLSGLASHLPVDKLLIPPAVYLHDRRLSPDIEIPYVSGRRAFGARHPLPRNIDSGKTRLPRVLRETTGFILLPANVKMEGLFRIPPHSLLAGVLKEAYDRGQKYIVWKERDATLAQPGMEQSLLDEVRLEDAYGVHLAASLIKSWYRDLREPIFPESSYAQLRERYSHPDTAIEPEHLVDFLHPASKSSVLSNMSREILTRHLLPLLSAVAAHEPENKMNSENLAICFAMALVCGSNQLEDAKMTSIIRRILQATIDMWPQLREGLGLSEKTFLTDLQPPTDSRDYEDPLDESRSRHSEDDAVESNEGHRIVLADDNKDDKQAELPNTMHAMMHRNRNEVDEYVPSTKAPKLPPRPAALFPSQPPMREVSPAVPKRKPAPQVEPPRYSAIFDRDATSQIESPASYGPPNGTQASEQAYSSYTENEKKGFPSTTPSTTPSPGAHPLFNMPTRKAVSTDPKPEPTPTQAANLARSNSDGPNMLARIAAQKAANNMAQKMATSSAPTSAIPSNDGPAEHVFRKPSWPASANPTTARQQQLPMIAKPTPPPNYRSPDLAAPPVLPRMRAPSPGLMKRMTVIGTGEEKIKTTLEPRKISMKKASVDDLRRLYEERVSTAQGLARADEARRRSSQPS